LECVTLIFAQDALRRHSDNRVLVYANKTLVFD